MLKEISRANDNAEKVADELKKENAKFAKYVDESLKIEKQQMAATQKCLEVFEASLKK